mgnify:FL=1
MAHRNIITGSFDPPTHGHLSIINRAQKLLGEVTVVVCSNLDKKHMFDHHDRLDMVVQMVKDMPNVRVMGLGEGHLISSFIKRHKSKTMIRGVRNGLDLEYERSVEQFVKGYGIDEVLYLLNEPELSIISSSLARNHLLAMKDDRKFDMLIYRHLPRCVVQLIARSPFADEFCNAADFS